MSYGTIAKCATDKAFLDRLTAACAQEGRTNPQGAMGQIAYPVSVHGDIEAAYASALAAQNPNPGGDESVITDAMILGAVQEELAQLPPA